MRDYVSMCHQFVTVCRVDFIEYHAVSRDRITVSVRRGEVTLGEARRILIEKGVPSHAFILEYFTGN